LVLKVPHHGGDTSLTKRFLEAVSPQAAIISVGANNRFGHPSAVTLDKVRAIQTYRTDQDGSLELLTDGQRYWMTTKR
jgi:competence protein ComEC